MASTLRQAFGDGPIDLYADILKVTNKECTLAQLRKAYYQQALQYHPDKNPSDDAKVKFQAISWAYQFLKDPENRALYDETGNLPMDDSNDSDNDEESPGSANWKDYFDLIFGKISTSDIDQFAMKYKMSEEEEKDVLKHYEDYKGDLVKMLEYVMLSEERDVSRWVEDYIRPAIDAGTVPDYSSKLESSMNKVEKGKGKKTTKKKTPQKTKSKASSAAKAKAAKKKSGSSAPTQDVGDDEDTETEDSDNGEDLQRKKRKTPPKSSPAAKSKPVKGGRKRKGDTSAVSEDLVAAIRNKNRQSKVMDSLFEKYGCKDDPMSDEAFEKMSNRIKKRKNGKK